MATKRMFTKLITDDDHFSSLSSSAQALYLHLSMSADDDGFCNQVSLAMFKAHASVSDLEALLERRYIYQFENGVIVIKHWRMANALRKDRYTPTTFKKELALLSLDENGAYTMDGCQMVAERLPDGCHSIGKDSIDKDSIGNSKRFTPPTIDDIRAYCSEKSLSVDPDEFFRYFSEGHWIDSKGNKVRNWKQKLLTWNNFKKGDSQHGNGNSAGHSEDGVSEWDIHYSI